MWTVQQHADFQNKDPTSCKKKHDVIKLMIKLAETADYIQSQIDLSERRKGESYGCIDRGYAYYECGVGWYAKTL
jgi:hypothetical protein